MYLIYKLRNLHLRKNNLKKYLCIMNIWKTFLKMGKKVSMLKIIYSGICKLESGPRDNYPGCLEYEYYLLRDL